MPDPVQEEESHACELSRIAEWCAGALLCCLASVGRADFIVAANSTTSLNGGALNLSCTDLIVAGTLNIGSGAVLNARNVTVQAGGVIQGGSGFIALSGDWSLSPTGQFVAGTSDVHFDDNCVAGNSLISGSTTFYDAHFTSMAGKSFVVGVNSTQTITHLFEFTGTASAPSQFRSSVPGQVAFINLDSSGTQQISLNPASPYAAPEPSATF